MLSLPPSVRILLAREPADMRKGFDGLSHLVQSVLRQDPLTGHLFVFRNRRGDRVKLLLWDPDGFSSSTRSTSETAPIPAPLQESADTPIIALAGLLRLAEWVQAQHPVNQGGGPCHEATQSLLPPRTSIARSSALDHLWSRLTDEQRQRTLLTLSSIVIRQLDAPRDEQEVRDELS